MFLLSTVSQISNNSEITILSILAIFTDICQIIGTIVLIWTAHYAKKQYESQKTHARITKAAELSKHFCDSLIPIMGKIVLLNNIADVKPLLEKIPLDEIRLFNYNELSEIIKENELEIFKAALLLKISDVDSNSQDDSTFGSKLSSCLNDLEYFCINFNSKIADTNTVYQSLHQGIFTIMPIAYIYISSLNKFNADKYYTNITATYYEWRQIYIRQCQAEKILDHQHNQSCVNTTVMAV